VKLILGRPKTSCEGRGSLKKLPLAFKRNG
jgi:hypothetical protein